MLTGMKPLAWDATMERTGYKAAYPALYARILRGIIDGVDVDFTGDRTTPRYGANIPILPEYEEKVSAVIAADCASGKKAGPFATPPFPNIVVSPIGAVPKKASGKIRVIHHLSYPFKGDSVNASIEEEYLPLSRFADAACAVRDIGRGCMLVKLDVEAAYKQVPVRRADWPLLGFKWQGSYYYERVLPFGLKSSCRIWDWYAAALHYFFEREGVGTVIHYIDDFLFVVKGDAQATHLRDVALSLCVQLGIPMAASKTEGPTACLTFLGIELDTLRMRARLPDERLAALQQLTLDWRSKSSATVKELQSLAGTLQFAASVVRPGRFFLRSIFAMAATMDRHPSATRHKQWALTPAVRADVAWWGEFTPGWNGISLLYEKEWVDAERIEFFTDACKSGYGALFGTEWFEARWSPEQSAAAMRKSRESMPFLELFALVAAALTWGHAWGGKKIRFRTDCEPVMYACNKGSSDDPGMMHLLGQLALHACRHNYDFRAVHIPGVDNVVADILSRDGACAQFRAACPRAALLPTPIAPLLLPPHNPAQRR